MNSLIAALGPGQILQPVPTEMESILVLINAGAGTVQKAGADTFSRKVSEGLAQRGVKASVAVVNGSELKAKTKEFAQAPGGARPRTLIVGGGDGTINTAAAVCAASDVVLGLLPLGTLNHFAKDLGIPPVLDGALDVIAAGNVRAVDAGEVNGRLFVNNSSIGIYPFLVDQRDAEQKQRKVGKLLALVPALFRTLRSASWHRITLTTEEGQEPATQGTRRTPCLFVGNNTYDLTALGKRSNLTAGTLCVYIVRRSSWWGVLTLPFKIAFQRTLGHLDPERDIELLKVSALSIRSHRPRLRIAIDGETVHEQTPLVYRSRPGALRVLAPALPEAPAQ
jgi:diacylglycerol kinase family enzyme